jgi:hypothetical protein
MLISNHLFGACFGAAVLRIGRDNLKAALIQNIDNGNLSLARLSSSSESGNLFPEVRPPCLLSFISLQLSARIDSEE